MLVRCLGIAAVCAVVAVLPVLAHHSHGNYDTSKWTTMEGKVTELHLLVPHSWLYVEVKDDKGEPVVWALEATGYAGLTRVGVKKEDVKPGDRVKIRCHLLRDGANGCLLGYVTPIHGDPARGHGVEKDWDGGGGAGFPDPPAAPAPR
ncbi:MAG TPA: DUF6152 family protein [Terriglobia bacterium]|nr:DUF6152 family protein [Terriglobia bacterium]